MALRLEITQDINHLRPCTSKIHVQDGSPPTEAPLPLSQHSPAPEHLAESLEKH